MRRVGGDVVPIPDAVTGFFTVERQDELALGDDADVLGLVTVRRYHGAFRIGREQDVAVLRLQPESVERPVERRKLAKQFRKMRHMILLPTGVVVIKAYAG